MAVISSSLIIWFNSCNNKLVLIEPCSSTSYTVKEIDLFNGFASMNVPEGWKVDNFKDSISDMRWVAIFDSSAERSNTELFSIELYPQGNCIAQKFSEEIIESLKDRWEYFTILENKQIDKRDVYKIVYEEKGEPFNIYHLVYILSSKGRCCLIVMQYIDSHYNVERFCKWHKVINSFKTK